MASRPRGGLVASGAVLAGSQYVSVAVGLLTAVTATRLLGAANYGVAALVLSFPSLLWSFVSVKPGTVVTRYLVRYRAEGRTAELADVCRFGYGIDLGASLLVLLLCGISSWWVAARVYRMPGIAPLMVVYGASFVLLSFSGTSRAVLSTWQRFRTLAALDLLERILTFALCVGLLIARPSVASFVWGSALAQAVAGVASLLVANRMMRGEAVASWWAGRHGRIPDEVRKELLAFFGWNYVLVSLWGVLVQVPLMALGRFRGPAEAGYYRLALTLVTVGSYTEMALARVYYPSLCAEWAGHGRAALRRRLRRWTVTLGLPIGAALALGSVLLPVLVPLVFGAEFRPAVHGIQLMMVGAVVGTVFFWQSPLYSAAGRFALLTKINTVYTAAVVGAILLAAAPLGFAGVAAVTAAGKVACTVALLVFHRWSVDPESPVSLPPVRGDRALAAAGADPGEAAVLP
jgi:O-antigen/teichoic acid export membrane protein